MTTEIGHASLGVIPTFDGFARDLDRGTSKAMLAAGTSGGNTFGTAAGKSAGSRFGSVFKTAAKAGLVGLGALSVGAFKLAKDSISAASDLEESTNKVAQIFGKNAETVFRFSEKAADALGQTNEQARTAAATFGIFGSAAGLADRKNARFAKRMTTLASDLASFNNTEPEQAVEALGAALRGESEPIRAYGVMLDEATLKAEAMALGILKPVKNQSQIKAYQVAITAGQKAYNDAVKEHGKESLEALKAEAALGTARDRLKKATEGTIPPLTQQQKLLAAQSQIFKQTEVAQGDFARTSDGLANQQRRLAARFEDAKARLGRGLLPIMTDAADFLLDKGIPAFEKFSDWFVKDGIPVLKKFGGFAKDAGGAVKDLAGFFNDLPSQAKIAGLAALLTGGVALKVRGGGGGALGTAGKALGLAKPVPVFVTNPGFGGGGVPGAGGKPGVPPIIPAGGKPLGKLPWYAALLPALGAAGNDTNQFFSNPTKFPAPTAEEARRYAAMGLAFSAIKGTLVPIADTLHDVNSGLSAFDDTLDLVGAKKVNPDLRIPNIRQEHNSLQAFYDLADKAARPIQPDIRLRGIERAKQEAREVIEILQALNIFDGEAGANLERHTLRKRREANLGGYGAVD